MKKLILAGLIMLLYGLFTGCSPNREKSVEISQEEPQEINDLPDIILIEENGKQFSTRSLPGNTILIFFGADCDHCQRETTQVHENMKGFEKYTLYFISMDPFPVIRAFAKKYRIHDQQNIRFARADGQSVFTSLGGITTPTILIFANDRKLVKRFNGETKIEEILKLL